MIPELRLCCSLIGYVFCLALLPQSDCLACSPKHKWRIWATQFHEKPGSKNSPQREGHQKRSIRPLTPLSSGFNPCPNLHVPKPEAPGTQALLSSSAQQKATPFRLAGDGRSLSIASSIRSIYPNSRIKFYLV